MGKVSVDLSAFFIPSAEYCFFILFLFPGNALIDNGINLKNIIFDNLLCGYVAAGGLEKCRLLAYQILYE